MTHKLMRRQYISLPSHPEGDFDHSDVLLSTSSIFIANTAAGSVEIVDGERLRYQVTIPGCPEASGVLAAQEEGLVFAAARGAGRLLVIDPATATVRRSINVGSRPNGLAWDAHRKHLLVVDGQDNSARLYVAIRDPGVINVVNTAMMAIDEQIATEVGAHTSAFDVLRQRLYVFLPGCRVAVL
jgi:YVTN family beta-propeller protein